jgi:GNAT superfamily N-acetyltransferase
LNNIIESSPGFVALEGGQLKGFLMAWLLSSFRGKRSVFSPEWANAVALPHSRRIYEAMYTHLAAIWVAEGYLTHLTSMLINNCEGTESWHWLGFGMIAADAVRDLQLVANGDGVIDIRQAGFQDIEQVLKLNEALGQHLASSPAFLIENEKREQAYCEKGLQNPDKAVWLAYEGAEAVAYMELGSASEDACTIIYDEKTTSIVGAFTQEERRGTGIATALLNRSLAWAGTKGYERCAVDFEPMNHWARRFWLRYFQPVCYTLIRQVDERVM